MADVTETLNHLCGIICIDRCRQERKIQETPPFKRTTIDEGRVVRVRSGVVSWVVTSTGPPLNRTPAPTEGLVS
jgi:hypothetical protein